MLIRRPPDIRSSEITDRSVYLRRREFLGGAAAFGVAAALPFGSAWAALPATKSPFSTDEPQTPLKDVTSYNNFYEFGTDKDDPAAHAHTLTTTPWKIKADGLIDKPAEYDLDDLIKDIALEERIYRMRCVEGWSMVIPWVGIPLASVLKRLEPQSSAKFVAFETLVRPAEMPGQKGIFQALPWPYIEGLRLDEAMHPLTILAVGLYGEKLPNQNGAPIRLVVPWKYGFKSIKSIVRISLTDNAAEDFVGSPERARVRLLFQRQSERQPSALEPGDGAADRRADRRHLRQAPSDADLQRLWRAGREPLCGDGPEEKFLGMLSRAPNRNGLARWSYSGPIRCGARSTWSAWCRRSRISTSASTINSAPIRRMCWNARSGCGRCAS